MPEGLHNAVNSTSATTVCVCVCVVRGGGWPTTGMSPPVNKLPLWPTGYCYTHTKTTNTLKTHSATATGGAFLPLMSIYMKSVATVAILFLFSLLFTQSLVLAVWFSLLITAGGKEEGGMRKWRKWCDKRGSVWKQDPGCVLLHVCVRRQQCWDSKVSR